MKYLSAALVIVALAATAAADLNQQFLDEYARALPNLLGRYVQNKKVVAAGRVFDRLAPTGSLVNTGTVTSVSDETSVRSNGTNDAGGKSTNPAGGILVTADQAYQVETSDGKTYIIASHVSPSVGRLQYEMSVRGTCLYFPLSYGGGRRIIDCFDPPQERWKDRYVITSREDTKLAGKPTVKLTIKETLGTTARLYLDRANDLAFLRYEADGWIDPKTKKRTSYMVVGELTYTATAAGPMPSRFESYLLKPDGTRVPQEEYTFTTYESYTPQRSDFDLEKQFGLKPLPPPMASGSSRTAGRSWWWLYAIAAALALVTAGLVVAARRRRVRAG